MKTIKEKAIERMQNSKMVDLREYIKKKDVLGLIDEQLDEIEKTKLPDCCEALELHELKARIKGK